MKNALSLLASLAMLTAATAAFAQAVPPAAEPSRVGGQIAPMQLPLASQAGPAVSSAGETGAPEGAEEVTFALESVAIDGMTVYRESDVSYLYKEMLGKEISLADVFALAEKLTVKYRNEGYVLTQAVVPPQTIEGGEIRLHVVEGFVDKVTLQGETRADISYLVPFAEKIRAARPLNAKVLERYVLLMNDIAGMTARAVLLPSPATPGASDLTLVVDQKPYDLFFQIDNRGSRYIGGFQANAGIGFNNLFGLYEGINTQVVTAPDGWPERELDYAGVTWTQFLDHEGTKLSLAASVTSTQPGFDLEPFGIEGVAHNYNAELARPFIRSRTENLIASVKFNYLNSERNDNLGLGRTEDRLRILRAGGMWQFTDRFIGVNSLSCEISKGLDILGASDRGAANMTRALGRPDFFKTTAEVSRLQRISDTFEFFASAAAQISPHTLLASEEFGVGGAAYGSAYDNSEITGEDGIAARLELRASNLFATSLDMVQLYGFYDAGKVWDKDNAVVKERERSLASAGAGVRFAINGNFSGSFEVAAPLTREVETADDNDIRGFATLTARF